MSQSLFAIDTDLPNPYSDQGESFSVEHFSKLKQLLDSLKADLEKNVPAFKLHFISSGSVKVEAGPSYRLSQLLAASPSSGALFRNLFTR